MWIVKSHAVILCRSLSQSRLRDVGYMLEYVEDILRICYMFVWGYDAKGEPLAFSPPPDVILLANFSTIENITILANVSTLANVNMLVNVSS